MKYNKYENYTKIKLILDTLIIFGA